MPPKDIILEDLKNFDEIWAWSVFNGAFLEIVVLLKNGFV